MRIGSPALCLRYISLLIWLLFPTAGNAQSERHLALGDFADFNKILSGAVLNLPNAKLESGLVTLRLSNVRCSQIAIGDLNLWSRQPSHQSVEVNLQVDNLDLFCQAHYSFSWLLIKGSGSASIRSMGNDATINSLVKSSNFMTTPPEDITVKQCNPKVNINDMSFSGGILGWILNVVERLLRNFIADNVESQICTQLGEVVKDTEGFLSYAKDVLDEFKPYPEGSVWDPLGLEKNLWMLQLPETLKPLSFRDPNSKFGAWLEARINQAVTFMNTPAKEPATGRTDMQANIFLRSHVLENGSLQIDSSDFLDSSYVYEGQNNIVKSSVRFDSVRLVGLDSLKEFNPFDNIGEYTFQNQVSWDYLAFEIKATIWMSPSTASNSIIEAPGNTLIKEEVEVFFGIDDMIAELSMISLIDQDLLEATTLGSFLMKDNVAPCLLSLIAYADFTSLSVDVQDVLTPSLTGFVSPGIDRIISSSMNAGFLMYEKIVLNAAPRYFQEKIRPLFAKMFLKDHLGDSSCPAFNWSGDDTSLIDFRDLLHTPLDAMILGGSGKEPYGDLFSSFVMPYLREKVFQADLFNDAYVRPFTEAQSGKEGRLAFSETFVQRNDTESILYDSMFFSVSDLRLDNLDTFNGPMDLLFAKDATTLVNSVALDGGNRDLTGTVRVSLEMDGENGPLNMQNTLDLSLLIPSSALSFDVMANVKEAALLNFPVYDMANIHCWLAMLDASSIESLVLLDFSLDVNSLRFRSNCVSCSSPGLEFIPTILQELETIGFNTLYTQKIGSILVGFIADYTNGLNIDELVEVAPQHCPHNPMYNPDMEVTSLSWPPIPGLRSESAETVLAIGVIALQSAIIVSAKNQLLLSQEGAEDQSEEILEVDIPPGSRIVNWTTLADDMGGWAEFAFDELRFALTSTVKESAKRSGLQLDVNNILREYLLDEEGGLIVEFDSLYYEAMEYNISLARARVYGLDTVTSIDPLVVTAPQSIENSVHFEYLLFAFEVELRSPTGKLDQMQVFYRMQDVLVEIDMNIALDLTKLENIQLGSIFDMGRMLYCAASGIHDLKFTKFNVQAGSIEDPTTEGYFSEENQENIRFIVENLFQTHRNDIVEALPSLFDSSLRKAMNSMMPKIIKSMGSECKVPLRYSKPGILDFRDLLLSAAQSLSFGGSGESQYGDLFRTLYTMLQERILNTGATNRPLINDYLRGLTDRYSNITGTMFFAGNALENSGRIKIAGFDAAFGLAISDVTLTNVDSVGDPLDIVRPLIGEPNTVNNTISFGVDSKPLGVDASLSLSIIDGGKSLPLFTWRFFFSGDRYIHGDSLQITDGVNIQNTLAIEVSMENVIMMASVLLKIAEENFAFFPIRDLANVQCWLATVVSKTPEREPASRGIALVDQTFSIGKFALDVNCTSCSSPRFDEFLLSLYDLSNASEAIVSVEEKTDSLFDSGVIDVALDYLVEDAVTKCPHRPEYDPDSSKEGFLLSPEGSGLFEDDGSGEKPIYFNVANSIVAAFILICGIVYKLILHRRNKRWLASLSREGHVQLELQAAKEKQMEEMLDETTTSLMKSRCIAKRVRYGVPLALAINLGLYLGAHLGILSVVDIDATFAGEPVTVSNFLEFTFIESTKKTFDNGGAEMVILLWIFTGVWPYIKIFLSLAMWIIPPTYLSVARRGRILLWNDTLAKLSIIDIFTLIVGVALLLVFIGGPDESFSSDDVMYSLKAIVVPRGGFYCIIIAQRISRVSSRFLLEYHEQAIQHAAKVHKSKSLHQHQVNDDDDESEDTDQDDSSGSALRAPSPPSEYDNESTPLSGGHPVGDVEMSSLPLSTNQGAGAEDEESTSSTASNKETRWGIIGAIFAGITILIVFIIGAIFAPSISLDTTSVGALAIESDKTYAEVVGSYGVFVVISGVLVKARFVFDDTADYIGFGLLLLAGVVSVGMVFIIQAYQFIKRKLKERKEPPKKEGPSYGHKGCGIPFYIRLRKWRHMEIYMISVGIGIWQLGSITSYAIYLYCEILHRTFDFMAFVGLVESSSAECYNVQAVLPENLSIILGSFGILMISFILQARAQYKKNIVESLRWIDDEDVPRLSLAWSTDMSKNSKYSHLLLSGSSSLTASTSWDTLDTSTDGGGGSGSGGSSTLRSSQFTTPSTPMTQQTEMMSQDDDDDDYYRDDDDDEDNSDGTMEDVTLSSNSHNNSNSGGGGTTTYGSTSSIDDTPTRYWSTDRRRRRGRGRRHGPDDDDNLQQERRLGGGGVARRIQFFARNNNNNE
eukprot:scaffold279_cov90-Cylindrotheca_fusiformis.AAC.3